MRHSNSKKLPYYFNQAQASSQWEPPAGTDTEKLRKYLAENHGSAVVLEVAAGGDGNGNSGKIRASHLLVKHRDSRRPSSWREVGGGLLVFLLRWSINEKFEVFSLFSFLLSFFLFSQGLEL